MAKNKTIYNRIQVVEVTLKITQAMKMIAISKAEQAKKKQIAAESYAKPLFELFKTHFCPKLIKSCPDYFAQRPIQHTLAVVVASDQGLCGGFNQSILQKIDHRHRTCLNKGQQLTFLPFGKKAVQYIQKKQYPYVLFPFNLTGNLTFDTAAKCSDWLFDQFIQKKYDQINIIHQPKSNAPMAQLSQIFPLAAKPTQKRSPSSQLTLYEPADPLYIIRRIMPKIMSLKLYKTLLKTKIAECKARMLAMSQATDNANELLKKLKLIYNRMRQTAITRGILEIIPSLQQ